ncbi:MAG: RidA family protein [Clostridia bacterium]|nr:RidA family protein [Clostridia bacterium]MBR5384219.1 RidA family protein [Clostridia bacterium]
MKKQITTPNAPAAIGPYSAGIAAGGFVFVSGQLPVDPGTGALCAGTIGDMTRQSLRNVIAVLEAAGSGADRIVKTTVFLADLGDFAAVNEAYAAFFEGEPPARSCVQVARLPRDARIEIEAIAAL